MSNPYQSPTTPAEKAQKVRGKVAWGKGLAMGVATWLGIYGVCLLGMAMLPAPQTLPSSLEIPVFLLLVPAALIAEPRPQDYLAVAMCLLPGVLLHATVWTIVFSWWRSRAAWRPKGRDGLAC